MAQVHLDFDIPADLPNTLPLMALRRGVLLPGAVGSYLVGRPRSLSAVHVANDYLLVGAQREPVGDPSPSDLLNTAVLARVLDMRVNEDKTLHVHLQGITRVELTGFPGVQPHLEARFTVIDAEWPDTAEADGTLLALRGELTDSADVLGGAPQASAIARLPAHLVADAVAAVLHSDDTWRKEVLCTIDPLQRADKVLTRLVRAREALAARDSIKERVQNSTRDQQREFLLRQQLKAIQDELGGGGDDDDDLTRLRERLAGSDLPDEVQEVVDRELRRLERISAQSPERSVAIDWLEWIADLPWRTYSAVDVDLGALESALDKSHYGLDDVKRQVVEHLAVRKLAGSGRADVLLLQGPPGVGKTSIGQAIADATGRKLVRVALGGVRDESELRGHRRTYIGARPGRLVEGLRRAGTADPVVLLDEIDKLGSGTYGDPASALLEVLDPEQNHAFVDRYLEVPFDLSRVLFVATANDLSRVPGPLRDRLQVIDIAGYTRSEKLVIARDHLLPRAASQAGMSPEDVTFTDDALVQAISGWTREAGVRELQRVLGTVYRAAAVLKAKGELTAPLHVDVDDLATYLKRRRYFDEPPEVHSRPGLATGLAWTPVGGTVLHVESARLPGRGQLVLTGQLGDVMKESARASLTYVLSNAERLGVPTDVMEGSDVHVHVPAGAVPKDGPSAGVTMTTSLASLFTGRPVRPDVAMTGEATLRGRVLPVGGIKSKVLAAHRRGMKTIILPRRNGVDLDDVPEAALAELNIVLVDTMDEVLEAALEPVATSAVRAA
ncbi:MAG: ATP-dependent Lon protease [Myxococcota bacterium]|jgi:ATP-dependent Lon protease